MASTTTTTMKETTVKVVLVGDSGVGKTSIVLRYVHDTFQPFQEPTIGAAFLSKTQEIVLNDDDDDDDDNSDNSGDADANTTNNNNTTATTTNTQQQQQQEQQQRRHIVHMKIWDTAGQERYQSLTPLYFRGAGAAICVYDICKLHSYQTLTKWIQQIRQGRDYNPSMMLLVVGNKSDLNSERSIQRRDAETLAIEYNAYYVETSAKDGVNIQELFLELARRAAKTLPADPPRSIDPNANTRRGIDLSARSGGGSCCYSSSSSAAASAGNNTASSSGNQSTTIME